MSTPRRPLSDLARLEATAASLPEILPELGPQLDAVLGIDSYAIHWYGADAGLTAFHADRAWSPAAIEAYLADYRSQQARYQTVTRQRLEHGEVFALAPGEMERRPVYHEVIAPLGLGSFLNLPLDLAGERVILTCARERSLATGRGRFTASEQQRARRIRDMLRPVFTASRATHSALISADGEPAALLLLDARGELRHACAQGRRFLALLAADFRWSHTGAVQDWLRGLLPAARSIAPPRSRLELRNGIFRIELRALGGTDAAAGTLYAVQIQRRITAAQRLLELARQHGLSARELAVARRLHQGEALRDIAGALKISETTLKTQTRSIYGRLGVADRHELSRAVDRPRE